MCEGKKTAHGAAGLRARDASGPRVNGGPGSHRGRET